MDKNVYIHRMRTTCISIKRQKAAILKTVLIGISLTLASILLAAGQPAPGRHPHYLHARADLRRARLLVEVKDSPEVHDHLHFARTEIDKAVEEIDRASVVDHQDVEDNPPIDTSLDRNGRLHKAIELLQSARKDIGMEEDNGADHTWKSRAYQYIDRAINSTRAAAKALGVTM